MGVVRRQSIYSSILVYVSMFIGYINLLVLMPKYFSPEQIGLTRTILTLAVFMSGFCELGASSVLYRFFPTFQRHNSRDLVWIIFTLPLIGFILFSSISFLGKGVFYNFYFEKSPELQEYIPLIYYLTFFTLIGSVASSYCIANLHTVFPKAINELVPKLGNTLLIIIFASGLISIHQYFFWFCTLTTISSICMLVYIKYFKGWDTELKVSKLTRRVYKHMIRYGLVAILGSSFLLVILYIDTIMLGGLKGQAEVASFNIGYYIINIMSVPFVAIISVVIPLLSNAIRHKRWDEVLRHYRQTSLNNFVIGAFIFVLLMIVFPELLNLMPKDKGYESSMLIVVFLGLGRLLDMITGCNSEIILLSKYYIFNLYSIIIVSIIKIILNYYLIEHYGMLGVAISGFIVLMLFNVSRFTYIYYRLGIQPFTINSLKAVLLTLTLGIGSWYILNGINLKLDSHMYFSAILQVTVKSTLWFIVFFSAIVFFNISLEINQFYLLIRDKLLNTFKIKT
ncbi:MAG: oligosaccharide flippase family protein [Saprospiraceae bacterium]|nr:oligosaccharide flippase family protein [Saprospiraceae bacterium]